METGKNSKQWRSRLAAYSTTAVATLAAAPGAEAAIHDITDGTGGNLLVNDSHTTAPVLAFQNNTAGMLITAGPLKVEFYGINSPGGLASGKIESHDAAFAGFNTHAGTRTISFAKDVPLSANIAAEGPFNNVRASYLFFQGNSRTPSANAEFNPAPGAGAAKNGYLAFKATQGTHHYYGWLRVRVTDSAGKFPDEISLVADDGIYGAYGLTSDDLKVGEVAPVPEPSSLELSGLGLLAMGAAGVRELRRKRRAKSSVTTPAVPVGTAAN